ncbi:oxalurate catabolism protein HpxZ [Catellatospora tritici]|uniref:oxalurate catabolism protein HpxZ n=1 Tax=Catellatospora tritici TaxID=2851566 RepID=UPI001C2CFBB3|nr:oxalurate catabolism protein HpxZ [Catellatospora tritici]MBV1853531.1 oxalurate catabolism protein HpxZ [Catellatospora tritici]
MDIDRPEVVAQVAAAFTAYEKALVGNDPDEIMAFFHDSPDTVRFGIADRQTGWKQQHAWRREQPPLPPGRTLHETRISTFGDDLAVVTTCFSYPGGAAVGRQSQTWVRLPDGWRIVSAHVSHPAG